MIKLSIPPTQKASIFNELRLANLAFQQLYPGERIDRQPIHTVYGGAHLFKAETARVLGDVALKSFLAYAPDPWGLAQVLQFPGYQDIPDNEEALTALVDELEGLSGEEQQLHPLWLAREIHQKIIKKLESEAVEDFRIDFEDG